MKNSFVLMLGFVVPLAISCHVSDVDSDVDTKATSDTATGIDTESITGVDTGPMIDTATSVDPTPTDDTTTSVDSTPTDDTATSVDSTPTDDSATSVDATPTDDTATSVDSDSLEPVSCTFGMDQTCNDSGFVSAIWGTCHEDGTCTCIDGFVVNAATGRCMPEPQSENCIEVTDFECGFESTCIDGTIFASWHVHILIDDESETIEEHDCTYSCPNGCDPAQTDPYIWPSDGEELTDAWCL
jgi:hypothetical protein